MRFAVFAEDDTDAEVLRAIVRKLLGDDRAHVLKKGFQGKGNLLKDLPLELLNFEKRGATHFVICMDSDGEVPDRLKMKIREKLSGKSHKNLTYFIAVAVQELEAWLIADELAIMKTIPLFALKSQGNPETISNPKEWLINESRQGRTTPLYRTTKHNSKVAVHLNLDKVAEKCLSFRELKEFILKSKSRVH